MTKTLLSIEDLSIWLPSSRGPLNVVRGVDIAITPGEAVGIAGESGCGKTLTALALIGLLPPGAVTNGRACFEGRDLLTMRPRELERVRGARIAMVFQDPMASLHPMLPIGKQVTEHLKSHQRLRGAAAHRRGVALLELVQLPDPEASMRHYPHQLSGGMRQRVAIAMALASKPKLLIADEPTTALDVTVQAGILRLLKRLAEDEGLAVVFISHDLGVLGALTERLYIFYAGRVVEHGPAGELLREPRHPYSASLLQARPDPEMRDRRLVPIPGAPPPPGEVPTGCVFHPRCPRAVDVCSTRRPRLIALDAQRATRCPIVAADLDPQAPAAAWV